MPKHWTEYTEDELLNFDGPQTADLARCHRIMQKHSIDAMLGLKDCLTGLSQTIHNMHQGLKDEADAGILALTGVGNRLTELSDNIDLMYEGLTEKADEAFKVYEHKSRAQEKQQKAIRWLTIILAASTVFYTLITGASVWATFQSNHIRTEMLELQRLAAPHST